MKKYDTGDTLLTTQQVAERLQLKNYHTLEIWRCTKRYDLPYIKIGRLIRYRASDVEAFIDQHRIRGPDA